MKCPRCKTKMAQECLACGYQPKPTDLDRRTDRAVQHQGQPVWPPQANPLGEKHSRKRIEKDE